MPTSILKFEFNVVDASGKAAALSTVQIDHENGKRYDLKFLRQGRREEDTDHIHCSPSGAIERTIYSFLELSYIKQEKGGGSYATSLDLAEHK